MDIKETVRAFIATNFYVPDPAALADGASLLDQGIIDSTGVLELAAFIQSKFEVQVADDELLRENLDSIASLEAYITRKLASSRADAGVTTAA